MMPKIHLSRMLTAGMVAVIIGGAAALGGRVHPAAAQVPFARPNIAVTYIATTTVASNDVLYVFSVKNTSTVTATNVALSGRYGYGIGGQSPYGLTELVGSDTPFKTPISLGTLGPGQSWTFPVTCKAPAGYVCTGARARASVTGEADYSDNTATIGSVPFRLIDEIVPVSTTPLLKFP